MLHHYVYALSALIFALTGLAVFWANPRRSINAAVCVNALLVSCWSLLTHTAINLGVANCLRAQGMIGGLIPLSLLWVRDTILIGHAPKLGDWFKNRWVALGATLVMAAIPWTDYYIPYASIPSQPQRGWGHFGFLLLSSIFVAVLFSDALRLNGNLQGRTKTEIRSWVFGSCILYGANLLLVWAWEYVGWPPRDLVKVLVGATSVAGTLGITVFVALAKAFDARSLLLGALKNIVFLAGISATVFALWHFSAALQLGRATFCALTAAAAWSSLPLKRMLDRLFESRRAKLALHSLAELARTAVRREPFTDAVIEVWCRWADTERAVLWVVSEYDRSPTATLDPTHPAFEALRSLRWATPKRLRRLHRERRFEPLTALLSEEHLGLVVIAEGAALHVVAGLGTKPTGKPYSLQETRELRDMLAIVAPALERIIAVENAAMAEHLATIGLVGASVAEEIRHPVAAIKGFAKLLPEHYDDREFRQTFSQVIKEQAARIDHLTGQLLGLSARLPPPKQTDLPLAETLVDPAVKSPRPQGSI